MSNTIIPSYNDTVNTIHQGYLHLIIGPMFSGKSTKLIHYIRKHKTLGKSMIIIKPSIDNRYTAESVICTHDLEKENCIMYDKDNLQEIFKHPLYSTTNIIIIEEGQFFSNIYTNVKQMTDVDKKEVYITALNGDSNRELFGEIYKLIPICDNIEYMQALCILCKNGTPGIYTKRLSSNSSQILVGSTAEYQAVCRNHYFK